MITIGVTGDVMLGRLVNDYLRSVAPETVWGDTLPLFQRADLNLINLECALTKHQIPVPKVFNFRSDPSHVASLQAASIDVCSLANNHILDFGEEGLLETLQVLDEAGIAHVGAGGTWGEATKPAILTKKGIRIGILGYTDNEPPWKATSERPGIAYCKVGDVETIAADLIPLRNEVDLLIVSLHWGPNMVEAPSRQFVQFAHALIDLGADLIHGHSAHIFQGVEIYKGKPILYDTGDFVDDYAVDPLLRNDRSFYFLIEANKKGIQTVRPIPTRISNFQVNRAQGVEAEEIRERMRLLSKAMGTEFKLPELVVSSPATSS